MSSPGSDGTAGSAAAADERAFSPDLGDGERSECAAAAATAQGTSEPKAALPNGTAASLVPKGVRLLAGGVGSAAQPTAGATEPTAGTGDWAKSMLEEIAQLKKKQKAAREAKQRVGRELRNAERRRKRLKRRAKQLSDSDLLAVISLRNHEKALGKGVSATKKKDDEDAESFQMILVRALAVLRSRKPQRGQPVRSPAAAEFNHQQVSGQARTGHRLKGRWRFSGSDARTRAFLVHRNRLSEGGLS